MRIASDVAAVTAAMQAYAVGAQWMAVIWLFCQEKERRSADRLACTTAISACEKAQRWELALSFFASAGMRKDAAMYNATISASSHGGHWPGVMGLLREMTQASIQKSATTYNSVLTALERATCWQRVLALLRDMPFLSITPQVISYNATMTSCDRETRWETVLSLLRELRSLRTGDCAPW